MPTLADPLRVAAQQMPEAPALITDAGTWTYAALDHSADLVAARLRRRGWADGARLALYDASPADVAWLLPAAWRAGTVLAPLSTRVPPGAVAPLLDRIAARVLVTPRADVPLPPGVERVAPEALLTGDSMAGEADAEAQSLRADQPSTIMFTSGSSGRPKAALHSVGNHLYSALGSNANIRLAPGDRWLLSLPLYHVGGLAVLVRCWLAGAAVAVPPSGEALAESLGRRAVTHVSLVETQLRRLLSDEAAALDGLRAILLGGSAIPAPLIDEAVGRGLPVHTTYGLTEMASQVTTTRPGAGREALRTSGHLLPYRELRLAEDGEVWVRGATRFLGYVEGDRLDAPFDADGWFATRDLGRLDAEGRLHVFGRADNLFISGGENVQPEEVEAALMDIHEVARAVVVAVPDATFGQRPVAFVAWRRPLPDAEVRRRLEAMLPRFKIPDRFLPWPSDTPVGMKVDRAFFERRAGRMTNDL